VVVGRGPDRHVETTSNGVRRAELLQKLVALAADERTPSDEARNAAVKACRLIRDDDLLSRLQGPGEQGKRNGVEGAAKTVSVVYYQGPFIVIVDGRKAMRLAPCSDPGRMTWIPRSRIYRVDYSTDARLIKRWKRVVDRIYVTGAGP